MAVRGVTDKKTVFFLGRASLGLLSNFNRKTDTDGNRRIIIVNIMSVCFRNMTRRCTSSWTLFATGEPWKVYPGVSIDVAMLQEVHANEGSDSVAVVDYSKMWTLTGHFLAAGDQVRHCRLTPHVAVTLGKCASNKLQTHKQLDIPRCLATYQVCNMLSACRFTT